jgi:uracil-DNA glycosylase
MIAAMCAVAACKSAGTADTAAASGEDEIKVCGSVSGPAKTADATRLWAEVPPAWQQFVASERDQPYFGPLATFVATARKGPAAVFPDEADTFAALELTAPEDVRVVILGQDPYIQAGQAHGLAFSVKPPTAPPPSLRNILKELKADLPETREVTHGSLVAWAKQGVLLLNAILTVEDEKSGSHACHGWESFSDAIIRTLSERRQKLVFVLWGAYAQSKASLIDERHTIIKGAHPSPLSADGFFGTRPFSQANAALREQRKREVDWQLPDVP